MIRKHVTRSLVFLGVLSFGALVMAGQRNSGTRQEAETAEALERLGTMLGLAPVSAEELERKVAQLGGLDFETHVAIHFMSREELARYIHEMFEDEYPLEFARREERMLRGFGFLSTGQDLRSIREKVLNENVAGFYDERPSVKKLFAISSGPELNVMNQLILSHELRHALQDQHVAIRDKLEVKSDFDDRRLSVLCLLEGDASILMQHYLFSGATRNTPELQGLFQVFSQNLSGAEIASMFAGPTLQEAPPVVQDQLIAPYFDGWRLAAEIYDRGGFALLNQKLRKPPRSMEQVLHPEKYLDGVEEPMDVALPEISGATPDFEGTLGEFLIRSLLRQRLPTDVADAAASGWGGDHYGVVEGSGGSSRLVWRTSWDSEADAAEFAAALQSFASAQFPAERVAIVPRGREVFFERPHFR